MTRSVVGPATCGPVVVDLRALQAPDSRGRAVGRYAYDFATALERHRPDLVGRYLLAPDLPPPGDLGQLLASGKVAYGGTTGAIPDGARVYHSLSVFEVAASTTSIWPPIVEHRGLAYSASVHDLLPLRQTGELVADGRRLRRHRARCEVLRLADVLLAISAATRLDLVEFVGVDEAAITVVGRGRPRKFAPAVSRAAALKLARELVPGLGEGFVLCAEATDSLNDVEALIAAFGLLPQQLRRSNQIVVCGDLPDAGSDHLRQLAQERGIVDPLLLTGQVSNRTLETLYQCTDAVYTPPLAEGCCAVIAEATTCGAVVMAADTAPVDELVPPEARYEARHPASIARVLTRALSDEGFRKANVLHVASGKLLQPWQDIVERAATVFERLASRGRRPWREGPRVALVSPFPPSPSGVARYSSRLAKAVTLELAAGTPGATLDSFVDGLDRLESGPAPPPSPMREGDFFDARHFTGIERAVGGYERVVYVLGNAEFHSAALAALRHRSGTVLAHDVRLTELLRHSAGVRGAVPGGLEGAIRRAYGDALPEGLGRNDSVSEADVERFGLLLLRDIAPYADHVLVSSEAARRLAEADVGPEYAGRLGVLPFAMNLDEGELAVVAAARLQRRERHRPLVASFGIVDPVKLPHLLLNAVAALRQQADVEVAFVGPVSDSLASRLSAQATELGIGERVSVTGHVDRSLYLQYLGWATVAVQLRAGFAGEASAAVGDSLAAGLPTIVSNLGWMADLPDAAVVKLDRSPAPSATADLEAELAGELAVLLDHPDRRARLSERGAAYAAENTFARAASALVAALGLPHR